MSFMQQKPAPTPISIERDRFATTMYRPVGPGEYEKLIQSDFEAWPPRLEGQPIFYPVTNEKYAREIATEWNIPECGIGYVTKFKVQNSFADQYAPQKVGAQHHTEWWIPAEAVDSLNSNIIGKIEVIGVYPGSDKRRQTEEPLKMPQGRHAISIVWNSPDTKSNAEKCSVIECHTTLPDEEGNLRSWVIGILPGPNDQTVVSSNAQLANLADIPEDHLRAGTKLKLFSGKHHLGEATVLG